MQLIKKSMQVFRGEIILCGENFKNKHYYTN